MSARRCQRSEERQAHLDASLQTMAGQAETNLQRTKRLVNNLNAGGIPASLTMTNEEMATKLENFESDLLVLVRAARGVVQEMKVGAGTRLCIIALESALDRFEPWLDNDDPRPMGKGKP